MLTKLLILSQVVVIFGLWHVYQGWSECEKRNQELETLVPLADELEWKKL